MAKEKKRSKEEFKSFWVMINLSGPRYWKVTAEGIEKTSAPAANEGPVLCFDETSDFRIAYPKKGSLANANKFFLTEKQEKCRVYAGRKMAVGPQQFTPYYGTPTTRIEQFEHRIHPGAYIMDELLYDNKIKIEQDRVVGLRLETDQEDSFCIVILFALRSNGEMSEPQVSLNPPEFDLIIRDFAQNHAVEDFEPILFSIDDVLRVRAGPGYPIETMVGTLPVRVLTNLGTVVILGLSAASFSYSGYLWMSTAQMKSQVEQAEKKAAASKENVSRVISENLKALAMRNSVNYSQALNYVDYIYSPILKIDNLSLTREEGVYVTRLSLEASKAGTLNDYALIEKSVSQPLPEGLTRKKIIIGADGNAYKIEFEFKPLDSTLNSVVGTK